MSEQRKQQLQGACCECNAMWCEYAHAVAEFMKLQLDVYMATASHDWGQEAELNNLLIAAEARRVASREIVRRHEDAEHNQVEQLQHVFASHTGGECPTVVLVPPLAGSV